jgi:hypothetical protein
VTSDVGACTGSVCTRAAAATCTWVTAGANDSQFSYSFYENGVLLFSGMSTASGNIIRGFAGYAQAGGAPLYDPVLTHRIDVINKATSQVVASYTAATYSDEFGTCGGPH